MRELITELRSGNWVPGRGALRQITSDGTEKFCCLGVACEIAVRHGVIPPATKGETEYDSHRFYYGEDRVTSILPDEVAEWYGIDRCPVYGKFIFTSENDRGTSQAVLADHFELLLESETSALLP